jgi:anthranilate phosphoribosyltransferase
MIREQLETVLAGRDLSSDETTKLFGRLVAGELDAVEISALLVALRAKGEKPAEVAGAARALRRSAAPFPRPGGMVADSCGTGGDGAHTINISTAGAVVAAAMGIPLAKHGNRSISSKCGSADVLERWGIKLDLSPEAAGRCLKELGICFLFAPLYHQGLRHAGPVRQRLAIRTVMNLLGPLVNPAQPSHQIMGVYDPALCRPVAETLGLLGCEAALVVHGSGLDEIALHGPTTAALYRNEQVTDLELSPAQAGLGDYPLEALRGGSPEENAAAVQALLQGRGGEAQRSAVAINSGALAWICGRAENLREGTALALETLNSGACWVLVEKWAELSHGA